MVTAFLVAMGEKGKRFALPNAELMIHQVMGEAGGQATDIEISAKHILKLKDRLNKLLSQHSGQPYAKIEKDTERDFFMTADEAKTYGLIDKVIQKPKK